MRRCLVALVVAAIWGVGCASGAIDTTAVQTSTTTATSSTAAQDPAPIAPTTTTTSTAVVDDQVAVPDEYRATDFTRLRSELPFSVALTVGRRLTITFSSGARGTYESDCAWDHRLDIAESDDEVTVSIVAVRVLAPLARPVDCLTESEPWAVTTTLTAPVGNRVIIDATTGREVDPVQIETRLLPTMLPDEWYLLTDDRLLPQRLMRYSAPEGTAEGRYELLTTPITMLPRLSGLRTMQNWEEISVRGDGDGVIVSMDDGSFVLGFEEQGWYYEIRTGTGVGADERALIEFARSFERPALADPGTMTPEILFAVEEVPPQAGQEEGESGWLMALPGDQIVR